jgi:hypothetical protein
VNLFCWTSFIALVLSLYAEIRRDFWTNVSPRIRIVIAARKAGPVSTATWRLQTLMGLEKQDLLKLLTTECFAHSVLAHESLHS